MKKYFMLVLALIYIGNLQASEIDSFQFRYLPLQDSSEIINNEANRLLKKAVMNANKRKGCNEKRLYKKISKLFKNHYRDQFSKFIYSDESVHRRTIGIRDSIYKDFSITESFIIGGLGHLYEIAGSIVRMGPYLIGTDKFEHLFGRGYAYFKKLYFQNMTLENVFKYGIKTEKGILGASMTGVMSYADLAANFNGLLLWNHLLKRNKDVFNISDDLGPYIECKDNKWVNTKPIKLENYIDHSMDEAINCSKFKTPKMVDKIKSQLSQLESKDLNNYQCPINHQQLINLKDKYHDLSKWFINFSGHTVVP